MNRCATRPNGLSVNSSLRGGIAITGCTLSLETVVLDIAEKQIRSLQNDLQ